MLLLRALLGPARVLARGFCKEFFLSFVLADPPVIAPMFAAAVGRRGLGSVTATAPVCLSVPRSSEGLSFLLDGRSLARFPFPPPISPPLSARALAIKQTRVEHDTGASDGRTTREG